MSCTPGAARARRERAKAFIDVAEMSCGEALGYEVTLEPAACNHVRPTRRHQ